MWQWGQFLDHDIDLTPVVTPAERLDIAVPRGDLWFDPHSTGAESIPLARSLYTTVGGVRQQMNQITAFIDASTVYGSDAERANALRTLDGTGRLKTSAGNLLPFNEAGLPNAPSSTDAFFLAGDFRANEVPSLTAMHTLFVREHNYWARQIRRDHSELDGNEIYEQARAIVAGELQAITYREFLPVLLGPNALPRYAGYDSRVNPGIANEFATAAFRFGHSMLTGDIWRLDSRGRQIADGHLPMARAFFQPDEVVNHGIDSMLRGLAAQRSEEVDTLMVDGVRNFLFGEPGSGGFDLAALNIQRGRDHGLASYNQTRQDYGLRPARSFADVNPDPAVQANLADVYDSVDDIDLWVGGLAEPHRPGALVGETVGVILTEQFRRLRDGDRFWYQAYLPADMVDLVEAQTLARIIRRNTDIGRELPDNVWRVGRRN